MSGPAERIRRIAPGLAYFLCACLAYLPVLIHGRFLCDDFILLDRLKQGLSLWNYKGADFYRPAVSYTLQVMWKLFGNHPLPYYLLNLLLLTGAGLLVRAIWLELTDQQKQSRSAFVAGLIFVLWVTHSETVSWISGITDGLAVFLSAAALLAYLRHRKAPTPKNLAITALILWLSLLSKEASIAWIPILLLFALLIPTPKDKWKSLAAEALLFTAMAVAYVFWRTHVIGQLVGGYGTAAHLTFTPRILSPKLARHMANAFVPFNKLIALWVSTGWAILLTAIAGTAAFVLPLRKLPREKDLTTATKAVCATLLLAGLSQLPVVLLRDELFDRFSNQLFLADAFAVVIVVAAFRHWKIKFAFDGNGAFLLASLVAILLYANNADTRRELATLVGYLWFSYATRPQGKPTPADKTLIRIAFASFAAIFIAVIPTVSLKVGIGGESSRFSYGPSFFSALSLASVALLYIKPVKLRFGLAVPALLASTVLLYQNNVPWGLASEVSGQTTDLIKTLLPARRIYVLSAPGSLTAAILFRIGIEHVAAVVLNDPKVQVNTANYMISCADGDRVDVTPFAPDVYKLSVVQETKTKRFSDSYFQRGDYPMTKGWFTYPNIPTDTKQAPYLVKTENFDPTQDHVIVIDCTGARLIK